MLEPELELHPKEKILRKKKNQEKDRFSQSNSS